MSHFITNTKNLENQPLFDLTAKDIISPNIKKYIKASPFDKKNDKKENKQKNKKQSIFLNTICKRLQREEYDAIHQENAKDMTNKFNKLKRKMKINMQRQSVQKILNSTFQNSKLDIRAIIKMHPQRVQLQKKYGNHILLKMQIFKQAEQITDIKEKYFKWYDDTRNDRCNSPIFNKMTYLLERTDKENSFDSQIYNKTLKSKYQNTLSTTSFDNVNYLKMARHTTKQKLSPLPIRKQLIIDKSYINRQQQLSKQKEKFSIYR